MKTETLLILGGIGLLLLTKKAVAAPPTEFITPLAPTTIVAVREALAEQVYLPVEQKVLLPSGEVATDADIIEMAQRSYSAGVREKFFDLPTIRVEELKEALPQYEPEIIEMAAGGMSPAMREQFGIY